MTRLSLPPYSAFVPIPHTIKIVDVGANPIDGDPPYRPLLKAGSAELIGFEPNPAALKALNASKSERESYFPYVVADGKDHTLYICKLPGMTSLLKPHAENLALFEDFSIWGRVIETRQVQTVRLDDVPAAAFLDYLKIDIQGGELMVFENAPQCLGTALIIHTEVSFIEQYVGQPLYGTIDQFLMQRGFRLYRMEPIYSRLYQSPPLASDGTTPRRRNFIGRYLPADATQHTGSSQFLWADAIYIKDLMQLDRYSSDELLRLGLILHECYAAYDVVQRLLVAYDNRMRTTYSRAYTKTLTIPA